MKKIFETTGHHAEKLSLSTGALRQDNEVQESEAQNAGVFGSAVQLNSCWVEVDRVLFE